MVGIDTDSNSIDIEGLTTINFIVGIDTKCAYQLIVGIARANPIVLSESFCSNNLRSPSSKRNRVGLPSGESEFIVPDGGASDFTEPLRFQRVLQGQDISNFNPFYNRAAIGESDISYKGVGFGESFRFHKVLQGQEIFVSSLYGKSSTAEETRGNESLGVVRNSGRLSGSRRGWSSSMQGYNTRSPMRPSASFAQVSSPSLVLMFQQASNPILNFNPVHKFNSLEKYGTKLLPASIGEHDSHGRHHVTMDSFCHANDSVVGSPPLAAQPALQTNQELASSC
ncbi:Transcriptional factor B3 family protein / auxin-responsive factor AUX/IAA-related isoform 2 [Hibiscus syriacus]|uniref:Transcriptional factor B3 family protein / auxin-responsive factor AUX/IAA-related isoform 2 n=1 Tax=Hibiscus syriacus TaxID=106335 RepID=A0A6A2Y8Q0_HIBSY|nr:Transcriptional factor B3 family protein / auxin-responsive factor AUX/IAA-related isoform 2 [Hibiscus syriacus]